MNNHRINRYKNKDISELYKIAYLFRSAIEEAIRDGELKELSSFPVGCCGFTSDLLQRFLYEQYGFSTIYVSGQCGYGWNGESHAWIETENEIVIDITADQYKTKRLRFVDPVYVGPRTDGFHDKFRLDEPIAYSRDEDPFGRNKDFDRRYEVVVRYLQKMF